MKKTWMWFKHSLAASGKNGMVQQAGRLFPLLFPPACILCRRTITDAAFDRNVELCAGCYQKQSLNRTCCQRCALPLADLAGEATLCGRCIRQLPEYHYVKSLFRYEADIVILIHQLKFSAKISYARSISEMLFTLLDADDLPDCFLPVPLHTSRLRQRGFNQSIEISRVLARKTGIPIEIDAVERQRRTVSQTDLDAKQRRKNVRGVFRVSSRMLDYKHVLIIDDVMTTGATVNELARVLKRHGVERVGVLCIARAPARI
jgi:ComF family protein